MAEYLEHHDAAYVIVGLRHRHLSATLVSTYYRWQVMHSIYSGATSFADTGNSSDDRMEQWLTRTQVGRLKVRCWIKRTDLSIAATYTCFMWQHRAMGVSVIRTEMSGRVPAQISIIATYRNAV